LHQSKSLTQFLEYQAAIRPGIVALEDKNSCLTFAEWFHQAESFAGFLAQQGIAPQSRVLIYLSNACCQGPLIFGALMAQCVFVVVSPDTKGRKLTEIVENCEPAALICDLLSAPKLSELAESTALLICTEDIGSIGTTKVTHLEQALLQSIPDDAIAQRPAPDSHLAALVYTSGSSGTPKGVAHTMASMRFSGVTISQYLELDQDSRIFSHLPLAFDYGLYQLLFSAITGAYLYIADGFTFPSTVADCLVEKHISVFPSVPTAMLVLSPLWAREFPLLKTITSTGENLPLATIKQLSQACPHAKVYKMYGLTECKRVSYLPPEKLLSKPESVGKAMKGTNTLLLDESLQPVKIGEPGKLYIQGPHLMQGYWRDPALTAQRLIKSPFNQQLMLDSGDYFTMDEERDLFFVGRGDAEFKIRGMRAHPAEIERCAQAYPGVEACAAIKVNSSVAGQEIVLLVQGGNDIDLRQLQLFCKKNMESHLVPRKIQRAETLPYTSNGKLDRRQLLSWLE